jgi:hypothetical protein
MLHIISLNIMYTCAHCLRCCCCFRDEIKTVIAAAATAAHAVAAALALAAMHVTATAHKQGGHFVDATKPVWCIKQSLGSE